MSIARLISGIFSGSLAVGLGIAVGFNFVAHAVTEFAVECKRVSKPATPNSPELDQVQLWSDVPIEHL